MKFVVMAGGQGTKLWPISRDDTPKQFIKIIGEKTLYQDNVETLLTRYSPQDIFVSIPDAYINFVKQQTPLIPEENYIVEPTFKERKMTGPASGYAMLKVAEKYPDEVVMFYVQPVVTRKPADKYLDMIAGIEKLVKKYGKLVTGGKYPLYPETGSDYLQLGKRISATDDLEVYNAAKFIERPKTLELARELINTTKVSLHCNHSTWTSKGLLKAFKEFKPDWYEIFMEIKKVLGKPNEKEKIKELYAKFEPGNIELLTQNLYDKGEVQVVILPFEWKHITTWNDVYEHFAEEGKETVQGSVVEMESENNIIVGDKYKLITTIGLKDFVVIDTKDALLICPKNESGKLTKLLKIVGEKGWERLT